MEKERPKTVNMLLDVENYSGEHSGSMTHIIIFFVIMGIPVLLYINFLIMVMPIWLFLVLYIPFGIRMGLRFIGKEAERVKEFQRQNNDQYSSALDLMNVKHIHDDGLIEYVNGTVAYFVTATNGSQQDDIARAGMIRNFFSDLASQFVADIHVFNIVASDDLSRRYDGVKFFADEDIAKDFIELIDYNRQTITESSLLTMVLYVVRGRKSDFKNMKESILTCLSSEDAKAFRTMKMISTRQEAEMLAARDIDAYIDFVDMQRKRYRTGKYYDSKVIGYDLVEEEVKQEEVKEMRGFIVNE